MSVSPRDLGESFADVYREWFPALVVAYTFLWGYLDTMTTLLGVGLAGPRLEANVLMGWLLELSPAAFFVVKVGLCTLVGVAALRCREDFASSPVFGVGVIILVVAAVLVTTLNVAAIAVLLGLL